MFMTALPLSVLANSGDGSGNSQDPTPHQSQVPTAIVLNDGTTIERPTISTQTVNDLPMVMVDLSPWDMAVNNITIQSAHDYVNTVTSADFFVLVFPENITPTQTHVFNASVSLQGISHPVLLAINGLGQLTHFSQSTAPILPDVPHGDIEEDWFLNTTPNPNTPIIDDGNPNDIPTQGNGRVESLNPEQFWNNELEVWNFPANTLVIRKENAVTGELLAGARFQITRVSSGSDSGLHGTIIGEWFTDHSGLLVIAGLDPGFYVVEETQAPPNFTLSANTRQHVFMRPDDTSVVSVTFSNLPFSGLLITLRCSVTSAPIQNGEFRVTNSAGAVVGTDNGIFWSNLQGEILIPNIAPDSYIITQVTVPPQYVINLVQSTQTIRVNPTGQIYRVDFFSDPLSQLLITLRCEVTGQPIQGGEFRITNSAGNVVGSAKGSPFHIPHSTFHIYLFPIPKLI